MRLDAFVRMILGEAKRDSEPMLAFLYRDRIELPVYAKCLLGLEQHRKGDEARRDEVMKMISQFLKRDAGKPNRLSRSPEHELLVELVWQRGRGPRLVSQTARRRETATTPTPAAW